MQVKNIPMNEINDDPDFNCRGPILPVDVIDLAKDIKENGLIQPVVVSEYGPPEVLETGKKYRLLAGFRRFTAHKVLERKVIPASIKNMSSELEALKFNLAENLQRQNLNILQEARAIARLKNLGLSDYEAGKQLGMSRGWTQVRFMLLELPEDVQMEVAAGIFGQQNIRDLYTIWNQTGDKKYVYEGVKKIKQAKLRGQSTRLLSQTKKQKISRQKGGTSQPRSTIFRMMGVMQASIGNGLHTRALAWAANEISDNELFEDIGEYAKSIGETFRPPEAL